MAREMASEITAPDVLGQLAGHKTLGSAPPEELAWLAAHGTLRHMAIGDVLTAKGTQVEGMFVVLSGRIAIFIDRGAGLHKVMEWVGGDVTGLLPFSRLATPPGDSVAQEPTVLLAVPRDQIRAMTRDCHVITSILVHTMLDRTRGVGRRILAHLEGASRAVAAGDQRAGGVRGRGSSRGRDEPGRVSGGRRIDGGAAHARVSRPDLIRGGRCIEGMCVSAISGCNSVFEVGPAGLEPATVGL